MENSELTRITHSTLDTLKRCPCLLEIMGYITRRYIYCCTEMRHKLVMAILFASILTRTGGVAG